MSALQALKVFPPQDNKQLICDIYQLTRQIKVNKDRSINLVWIPSHSGILYNDLADEAANQIQFTDAVEVHKDPSLSSTNALLKRLLRDKWHRELARNKTSRSLEMYRLVNPKFKRAPYHNFGRKTDRMINNLRTGGFNYCSHHEPTFCNYCDDNFSTFHYLLECPVTAASKYNISSLLKDNEFNLCPIAKSGILLERLALNPHILKNLIDTKPPAMDCVHEHRVDGNKHLPAM